LWLVGDPGRVHYIERKGRGGGEIERRRGIVASERMNTRSEQFT